MREISATIPSRSLLLADAKRRHPAGGNGVADTLSGTRVVASVNRPPADQGWRRDRVEAAKLRHPAGGAGRRRSQGHHVPYFCSPCGGRGWVRAVTELPLEITCPACGVTR